MPTYYVRKTGNNSNAGTSRSLAFLTIARALTASVANDTIYVGGGVYRENLTIPQNGLSLIGDEDGVQTGDAGEVILSNYLTDDVSAPSGTVLSVNGKTGFTASFLTFISGVGTIVSISNSTARNIAFNDCRFHMWDSVSASAITLTVAVDVASNLSINRCWFMGPAQGTPCISISAPTSSIADYDVGVTVNNCFGLWLGIFVRLTTSGATSGKPGGAVVKNCTVLQTNAILSTNTAFCSTTIPCLCYNSLCWGNVAGLSANAAGQIVEDYNRILSVTARTNVTAGAHSVSGNGQASFIFVGLPSIAGSYMHPLGMPSQDSPLLTFGVNPTYADPVDIFNLTRINTNCIGCFDYRNNIPNGITRHRVLKTAHTTVY